MLAIRKLARGVANVSVEELPAPVAGPEEVVAEVDSAGICGTDLHIYLDEFETAPPVTIGHEFSGRIVEVGKSVQDWNPGDRVTAGTYFSIAVTVAEGARIFAPSASPSARSEMALSPDTSLYPPRICIGSRTKSISKAPRSRSRSPALFTGS
jgi:NADPH:quinone reductase-like Zn-dependent oxidoreductase